MAWARYNIGERNGQLTIQEIRLVNRFQTNHSKKTYLTVKCDCGLVYEMEARNFKSYKTCGRMECVYSGRRASALKSCINKVVTQYRQNAKNRDLSFGLTYEEAHSFFIGDCFYCGAPASEGNCAVTKLATFSYNGIDRVDSLKGYSLENCVSCCWMCNQAKLDVGIYEYLNWIKKLMGNYDNIVNKVKALNIPMPNYQIKDRGRWLPMTKEEFQVCIDETFNRG